MGDWNDGRQPDSAAAATRRPTRPAPRRRFYDNVATAAAAGGHAVQLDGKPIRTPAGRILAVPTATLARALALAEPEGYIRLFLDEGGPMVTLLRQAYARSSVPDYVATLLSACGDQAMAAPSRPDSLAEPLTERELAVLRLLVGGLSNTAIAQKLVITAGTVKRHINSIYGKLGVQSRAQAVARAHTLHVL